MPKNGQLFYLTFFWCSIQMAARHQDTGGKNEMEKRRWGEPEIKTHRFTVSPALRFNLCVWLKLHILYHIARYTNLKHQGPWVLNGLHRIMSFGSSASPLSSAINMASPVNTPK